MSEDFVKRLPRGVKDILPEDEVYWRNIEDICRYRSESMGFGRITTPIIDFKNLFVRSVGNQTDVISKEMYEVSRSSSETSDETKDELILRPEATAQVARAFIQYGMHTLPQPVRLFYLREPMFRYERPQAGRLRQFFQYGAEIFGSEDSMADTLLIQLSWQIMQDLKISENLVVDINSIGCKECRPNIKKKITTYYKSIESELCPDCQIRLKKNPLRLLDCKNPNCQQLSEEAPQVVDNLCTDCQNHFREVLEILDDLDIPYNLSPQLVRGLDYYTRTVFEIREDKDEKRQAVLVAGGRYDNLIEELGGHPTPAVGFAFGYERVIEKMKDRGHIPAIVTKPELLIIQLGDKAKRKSLTLLSQLTKANFRVTLIPGTSSLRAQLRLADRLKIPISLIIGQREAFDNSVIIRNMEDSSQETVDLKRLESKLHKLLRK